MSILNLDSLQKPMRWNVQRGLVDPRFQGLWKDCSLALPFWDPGLGHIEDVSGYGNHPVPGTGFIESDRVPTPYGGQALQWRNQTSNYCNFSDPGTDLLDNTSTMSWEVRFYIEALNTGSGEQDGLLTKYRTSPGGRSWRLYLEGDGASNMEVELQVSSTGTNYESEKTTTCKLAAETWYQIIVTYDAGVSRLWLNGTEHALSDFTTATTIFGGDAPLDIGTRRGSPVALPTIDDQFNGRIASARIWRRTLSEFEARLLSRHPWGMYERAWPVPQLAVEQISGSPVTVAPEPAVLDFTALSPVATRSLDVTPASAVLDWTAVSPFAGTGAGPWVQAGTAEAGDGTFRIPGLLNGTSYDLKLESVDVTGNTSSGTSAVAATPAERDAVVLVELPRTTAPIFPPWTRS